MSLATNSTPPDVSVLVPAKDEADNLGEFVRLTREAMLPLPYAVELVIVNDGSHDGTAHVLEQLAAKHPFVHVVTHRTQRGIADALKSPLPVAVRGPGQGPELGQGLPSRNHGFRADAS